MVHFNVERSSRLLDWLLQPQGVGSLQMGIPVTFYEDTVDKGEPPELIVRFDAPDKGVIEGLTTARTHALIRQADVNQQIKELDAALHRAKEAVRE